LAALVCLLALTPVARADVFKPTRHNDPAPDKCKPADCSLREALIKASKNPDADKVVLGKGTYKLQIAPTGIPQRTGELVAFGAVTIRGRGPDQTTINGKHLDTVLLMDGNPGKLKGLKVKGGLAEAMGDKGGGLVLTSDVTLTNVVVTKNEAGFSGGGIWSYASDLTIKNSTISRNKAGEGGGIGLLPAFSGTPQTQIIQSTISLNQANRKAAGILADGAGNGMATWVPLVTLTNSTVAENTAVSLTGAAGTREGGGILADNGANVVLDNATVAFNRAGDLIQEGVGGGIYQHAAAVFNLGDSVIAANEVGQSGMVGSGLAGSQCTGSFAGAGGVVVTAQQGTVCSISGDIQEPDNAEVEFLASNGGPTETVEILPQSAAIGYAVSCPAQDQRHVARPATGCDSGAFEAP
jgi:hypothetical protein